MKTKEKTYYISIDHQSLVTDYSRSPERFGSWHQNNSNIIQDTFTAWSEENDRLWDLLVDFEPNLDTTYYLVYGEYETGDSFGHETGNLSFQELFEDKDSAWELRNLLDKSKDEYCIEYKGKKYYIPWSGYFDRKEHVSVKPVILRNSLI